MSTKLKIDNENAVLETLETGGDITVRAADDSGGDGGAVILEGGDGDGSGSGGAVFIRPGYGGGSAPAIPAGSGVPEPAEFWFVDGNSTPGYVGFKAPDDVSANTTGDGNDTVWTLPEGDGGANEVMITDGAGILSWSSIAGAGGLENVVEDTAPQLGGMLDVNGQAIGDGTLALLTFVEDGSAVNNLEIENEATGAGPILRAVGTDSDIDINITPKGSSGQVIFNMDFGGLQIEDGPIVRANGTSTTGRSLTLYAADRAAGTGGQAGDVKVYAGQGTVIGSQGGHVDIRAGDGSNSGGAVLLKAGRDSNDGTTEGWIQCGKAGTSATSVEVRFLDADNGQYLGLKAPASVTNDKVFEMAPKVVSVVVGQSPYAVDEADDLLVVDASGGSVVINLHSAANERFRPLNIKRIDASATNTVTINRAGGDLIDGATSLVIPISSQWTAYTLFNDKGTAWYIV